MEFQRWEKWQEIEMGRSDLLTTLTDLLRLVQHWHQRTLTTTMTMRVSSTPCKSCQRV